MFGSAAEPISVHLLAEGFLESGDGMLFIGPEAEQRFGFRHVMELTTALTATSEFTVLAGREEIGRTAPSLSSAPCTGPGFSCLPDRAGGAESRRRCWLATVRSGSRELSAVAVTERAGLPLRR